VGSKDIFLWKLQTQEMPGNCEDDIVAVNELDIPVVNVYPNPVIDMINIDVSGNLKYEATIYNLQGKIMISTTNQSTIDIQTLPQGTYLIKITDLDSGQNVSEKIIIE
jgi:hypothetical protein